MNLLEQIHDRHITLNEAEYIFETWHRRFHDGEVSVQWVEQFELTEYEATAHLHGAGLDDLVKLRYEGWPIRCCRCEQGIEYKLYGWFFVPNEDGIPRLEHLTCPP